MLNRRELLAGAAAAGTLAACGSSSKQKSTQPGVRDFAQFYLAAHGEAVQRAIGRHRAGLDGGTFAYMADHDFAGARVKRVALYDHPAELGCDAFVRLPLVARRAAGHGIMWAPDAVWPKIRPIIPSFTGDRTPGGFHALEHRWVLVEAFRKVDAAVCAVAAL